MKLGLSTAAFYGKYETEDAAAHIRRFSLECAEVFLETGSEYTAAFGALLHERLGGLEATSVHPLGTAFENAIFGKSPRQREDALQIFTGVMDAAHAVGAGIYVYHGQHDAKGRPLEPNFPRFAQGLERMCAIGRERGVRVCWENVEWCILRSPDRVQQVRALYPQLGFVLDVKQAMQAGHDALEFVPVMGDRLASVHVLDYDATGRLCLPGQGTYDFRRLFGALRAQGYDGPVILEPYATQFERDEELEEALAYLREAMEA